MAWLKNTLLKKIFTLFLALIIASFLMFSLTQIAQADPVQLAQIPNPFQEFWHRVRLRTNPPRTATVTGRTRPGGGRGPICALPGTEQNDQGNLADQPNESVMALMPVRTFDANGDLVEPQENEPVPYAGSVGGFTVEEYTTFWFYLPYSLRPESLSVISPNASSPSPIRIAQFVLLDHTNHPVWNELMSVELSDVPQLVEYSLPFPLVTNELYNWYFSVICDSNKLSRNPVVKGYIRRIEPTDKLKADLRNANRFEQYVAYGNNGFWFDAVNSLVKSRREFPSINREAWAALLDYFHISKDDRFNVLEPVQPIQREVVNGNQFPARIYGDQ